MPNENLINRPENGPYDRLSLAQHKLGTELGVIFACCYKLREGTARPLPPEAVALLHKIQRSAEIIRATRGQLIAAGHD